MKVVLYDIKDLIFSEYNPRQLTKEQYKGLSDSLKRFGIVDPIIINKHKDRMNIVIGGHQRLKVAADLEINKIPCVELKLTAAKEKELNIRLNKNLGEWDFDILANQFNVEDLFTWGFSEEELGLIDSYGQDFTLPDGEKDPFQQITFTLTDKQIKVVNKALAKAAENDFGKTGNDNANGNAIWWICKHYGKS